MTFQKLSRTTFIFKYFQGLVLATFEIQGLSRTCGPEVLFDLCRHEIRG